MCQKGQSLSALLLYAEFEHSNRWYLVLGTTMMALSVYMVLAFPLQTPVWAVFLAVGIALVFLVPCGVIAATTDTVIGLNVVTEFVAGFLLPGVSLCFDGFKETEVFRKLPIANITVKCLGYMTLTQAL
jgi:hypothetical protein